MVEDNACSREAGFTNMTTLHPLASTRAYIQLEPGLKQFACTRASNKGICGRGGGGGLAKGSSKGWL